MSTETEFPYRSKLSQDLQDLDLIREQLSEAGYLPPIPREDRLRFEGMLDVSPEDADHLFAGLMDNGLLSSLFAVDDAASRLTALITSDSSAIRAKWDSIAKSRGIKNRLPDPLPPDFIDALPGLVLDAALRLKRKSLLISKVQSHTYRNILLASLIAALVILSLAIMLLLLPKQPVSGFAPPIGPHGKDTNPSRPHVNNVSSAASAAIRGFAVWNALMGFVSLVLIVAGSVLLSKSPNKREKTLGAILTVSGLSLFSFKDFKIFENAIEKVELDIGKAAPLPVFSSLTQPCIIGPFADAGVSVEGESLLKSANDCVEVIRKDEAKNLLFVVIVGHVDRRELSRSSRRIYGTNFTLAYNRALAVKGYLARDPRLKNISNLQNRIVVLSAGPNYIGAGTTSDQMAEDRGVEVLPYWAGLSNAEK